ncbi:MAG TPA: MFS transporter, partial [Myxococcota bacterium]|nr:MFS transporter [Myxococcota bacterium]
MTRLPARTLLAYAAPALGFGFMSQLVSTYFMKYATDVLGISAAVIGAVFLLSRVWDAVADPVVGFLSDRTRSRWGRRRPWMLAGAVPAALAFAVLWAPPRGLAPSALAIWTGLALALSLTTQTAVRMPHEALGAELSRDYHERNRVFAAKRALFGVGALGVLVVLLRVGDAADPRRELGALLIPLGAFGAGLVALACYALREPAAHRGRGPAHPLAALRDLLANPHARRLLVVMGLQQIATGAVTTSAAYHAQYVLGDREREQQRVIAALHEEHRAQNQANAAHRRDQQRLFVEAAAEANPER